MSQPKALDKFLSKQTVKTLDGEKLYTFRLLRKRDAARIYHQTVSVLISTIAQAVGDGGPAAKIEAVKAIDFDTFWGLASALLKGCAIRPNPDNPDHIVSIGDLDDTEYFDDEREELYIAVYYALRANFPKSWGRIEKAAAGFGPKLAAMVTPSSTALTPDTSAAATSPSSSASHQAKLKKRGRSRSS